MDIKLKDNLELKLDITQLEYIESTGTQYIDTGIIQSGTDYIIEIEFAQTAGFVGVVNNSSSTTGGEGFLVVCSPTNGTIRFGTQYYNEWFINDYNKHYIKFDYKYRDNNGVLILTKDTTEVNKGGAINPINTYTIAAFASKRDGAIQGLFKYRLYSMHIKIDNNEVNLIPVKKTNGTVCMYDTISDTFFYNQGTGDFIAGPIIKLGLPDNILLKTTTIYHENTPNINGLPLFNYIINYQKTHQDEVKEIFYPTTQLWQDIITEYPDIIQYYNMIHKLCVVICEADDPEQYAENFLQIVEDYPSLVPIIAENPSLVPIIAENPSLVPIIAENPEIVHSLVDTGYETWLNNNGTAYLTTQLSFPSGIRLCGKFYFISFNDYISIAGTFNGKHNLLRISKGPKVLVCINSNSSSTDKLEYGISLNTKYDLDLSNRANAYIKNNDAIVASAKFSGDIAPTPIDIFAITRYDSQSDKQIGTLKSSAIKIYDVNDNAVLWLAPIENDGNPCMIDLLTGTKYLNQGTGSFTYTLEPKNT